MSEEIQQNKIPTPIKDLVESTQKDSTVGPLIGSIIIIIIMIIGGLYFLGTIISERKKEITNEQVMEEQNQVQQVEQAAQQSTSDDVSSIEADIKATNIDMLDAELNAVSE